MTSLPDDAVRVPSRDDLLKAVVKREPTDYRKHAGARDSAPRRAKATTTREDKGPTESDKLSIEAERFLKDAALDPHRERGLEERWSAIGVTSGSIKKRTLDELRRWGLIRLERKGRLHQVHLYAKAYEYLGMTKPSGEGVGGTTHVRVVEHIAGVLKRDGYEVHIEQSIGPKRKRVDLVAYGDDEVIGVEVGLSSVSQEIKNLREDLDSGVLTTVAFVAIDERLFEKVRTAVYADPVLRHQVHRIHFRLLDEEEIS